MADIVRTPPRDHPDPVGQCRAQRADVRRTRRGHRRPRLSGITNRRSANHADAIDAAENGLCDRWGAEAVAAFSRAHNLGHVVKQGHLAAHHRVIRCTARTGLTERRKDAASVIGALANVLSVVGGHYLLARLTATTIADVPPEIGVTTALAIGTRVLALGAPHRRFRHTGFDP